jgi:GTP-binding protein EngB required for normal cell division
VTANTIGMTGLAHSRMPARLASLTELTRIGTGRAGADGFSPDLLSDAEMLVRRSSERMRMSASHTVVALAGGTGSGKSSLFNALAGANFSPAGVTRPTTKHLHACVWGMEGAAPLLDWLSVQRRHRYGRASALDDGEASLTGLLLLDLPDHDSVVTGSAAMVDRLVKLVDMLVWVLDPLKYADDSVHRRYLMPLAGRASVTAVVLNQVDTLSPEQAADCEADLRRLLDTEGLTETPVLVTSAVTGAGLDDLRRALARAVALKRAASDRITADINAMVERFAVYAGDSAPGWTAETAALQLSGMPVADGAGAAGGPGMDSASAPSLPPWEQDGWDERVHEGQGAQGGQGVQGVQGVQGGHGDQPGNPAGAAQASGPPWQDTNRKTLDDPENGQAGGPGNWQPWQTTAASAPVSTSRPPWDDARPDGKNAGMPGPDPVMYLPAAPAEELTVAFAKAAGVTAATETLNGARERTAAAYVGWPPARLAALLRGQGQTSARRLVAAEVGDAAQAQRSDIDNAITIFADEIGGSLPKPWSRTVREAARARAGEAQAALGAAVARGLPPRDKVTGWWRLIALAQWLLMLLVLGGLVWIALILGLHGTNKSSSSLVSDTSLAPWLGVMVVALLLLGWLIASWCQNMVVLAADREREQANRAIMTRIAAVTRSLVLVPVGRELADYERFRAELAAAQEEAGFR